MSHTVWSFARRVGDTHGMLQDLATLLLQAYRDALAPPRTPTAAPR